MYITYGTVSLFPLCVSVSLFLSNCLSKLQLNNALCKTPLQKYVIGSRISPPMSKYTVLNRTSSKRVAYKLDSTQTSY